MDKPPADNPGRAMASICNDERASLGVKAGVNERLSGSQAAASAAACSRMPCCGASRPQA